LFQFFKEEEQNEGVNVMLDGVESILQFVPMDFDTVNINF